MTFTPETSTAIEQIAKDALDPTIATLLLKEAINTESDKFNGLLTAAELTAPERKVPRPKQLSFLNKRLAESQQSKDQCQAQIEQQSILLSESSQISPEQAMLLIKTAIILSKQTREAGLTYKDKSFNLALLPPLEIEAGQANLIAEVTYKALNATQTLINSNETARFLVEKGSTQLERDLTRQLQPTAPLNRIDLIGNQIIEFGPTYADGFGTADTLAQVWGMGSQAIDRLADTLFSQYQGGKTQPSIGLAYISQSYEMLPELQIVRECLTQDSRFGDVQTYSFEQALSIAPDILYFYFKPSMLDSLGYTISDLTPLLRSTCIVPPFNEQLGKKVILSMFTQFSDYYRQTLGSNEYQLLTQFTVPTTLVTPSTPFPDFECVIKPSSEGSNDGVIDNDDASFRSVFNFAKQTFNDPNQDAWVIQPKLKNQLPRAFGSKDGQTIQIQGANIRTVLLTALNSNSQPVAAGGFAAVDSNWIIADSGFNFPVRLKGNKK